MPNLIKKAEFSLFSAFKNPYIRQNLTYPTHKYSKVLKIYI